VTESYRQAGRGYFEIESEEGVAEVVTVLQNGSAAAGALGRAGTGYPGKLDLLERKAGRPAGCYADRENVTVQYIIELAASTGCCSIGIIDNQMIEFCRIMRIGEISFADHNHISGSVAVDK